MTVINPGGSSVVPVAFGLAAARPAAAAANNGTAFYATDTGELTVSNGAAWNTLNQTSATTFTFTGQINSPGDLTINRNSAPRLVVGGSSVNVQNVPLDVVSPGQGAKVAEGSNAKQGVATLAAGSVVVANTSVTATSRILITSQADGGTPGFLRVSARTAGTSFTVTSSSGTDTSTFAYQIFEPG